MGVFKEFRLESTYRLPNVEPGHKYGRLQGYSFVPEIYIGATLGGLSDI